MLKVEHISSGYGKKQVLYDVSFEVNKGEVVLLTGGNGSGKSTVLKCVFNLLPLWSGAIYFDGERIDGLKPSDMIRKGIVYIPQKNNYFESLTVHENLLVSGSTYTNAIIKQREQEVFQLSSLLEYQNRTPFNLSGGERQLLALGNALMHKPKLILFDEPSAGLDEANTKVMVDKLLKLKEQNISMLIVEHKKTFNEYADKENSIYLGKII